MGRPMSEAERAAIAKYLYEVPGRVTRFSAIENDSMTLNKKLKKLYYGGETEAQTNAIISEVFVPDMSVTIDGKKADSKGKPFLPEGVPKGLGIGFFHTLNERGIPAYLGILAEISLNPNITLEELNDVDSDKALQSKARAKEVLKDIFPKKNAEGEWTFNYQKFLDFVYDNNVKLRQKIYEYLQAHENDKLYDQAAAYERMYCLYDGMFDALSQKVTNTGFLPETHEDAEKFAIESDKCRAISAYMKQPKLTVSAMTAIKTEARPHEQTADIDIYKAFNSYCNRETLRENVRKIVEGDEIIDSKDYGRIVATANTFGNDARMNDKIGIFGLLSDFERNVLAADEDLAHKVIFKPRIVRTLDSHSRDFDELVAEYQGRLDPYYNVYETDAYYVDNDGNELPIQNYDDPSKFNLETAAKMKYEINQVILKDRYRNTLEEHGYSMDEIEQFQEASPVQRVAKLHCEGVLTRLNAALGNVDANDTAENYNAIVNATRDLTDKYEKFVENPTLAGRKIIDKTVDDIIASCQNFVKGEYTQDQYKVADAIFVALNDYKAAGGRLANSNIRAEELQKINQYSALEKVLEYAKPEFEGNENLPFANGLEDYTIARPEGMSEDEYNAIVIGAFLSEKVCKEAKIPGAEGELAKEKAWDAIINRIMINRETEDIGEEADIEEAFKLARINANAAIEAYTKGDKSAAKQCVKDFIDATTRMYDKDKMLERTANSETAGRELIGVAARVAATEDYKGLSNLDNTISVRNAIEEGIAPIVSAGNNAVVQILSNKITTETRKEAVLDLLTKVYLDVHNKEENTARNRDISVRLRAELAKNGIKLAPEINNADNFADMGVAVGHYEKLSRITDLEANFIGNDVSGKPVKDAFIAHVRAELEKTEVYRLVMRNNAALEDLAIEGEKSTVLTGNLRSNLMDIKYLRTHRDINNTAGEMEYDKQIQSMLPAYAKVAEAKNAMVDIIKEEVKGRPEVEYRMPLFAQYADRINASIVGKKGDLVKLGYSEEKLDALTDKISAYEASMKKIVAGKTGQESNIIQNGQEALDTITEIEKLYTDLIKLNVDIVDSPLALIRADKQLLTKSVAEITPENKAVGTFANMVAESINTHNNAKLAKDYKAVVSRDHMRNDVYPTVTNLVGVLKNAKNDKRYEQEYKTLIKGAQHLEAITKMLGEENRPENLNKEGFEAYRDALTALTEKANAYLTKAGNSTSERADAAMTARDLVASVMPQVSQVDKIFDSEASYKRRVEELENENTIIKDTDASLDSAIRHSIEYDAESKRLYSNLNRIFGTTRNTEGNSFAAELAQQFMSDDNNYAVNPNLNYSKEDMALLAFVMGFSGAVQGIAFNEALFNCGTAYSDVFAERIGGAGGDQLLGHIVENIKSKMPQLQEEMVAGNTENVKKYFVEGLRVVLTNASYGVQGTSFTRLGSSHLHRIAKDVADLLDRHQELKDMISDENGVITGIEPHFADTMKALQKFGTVMDNFSEAYSRVGQFIQDNRANAQITLDANSQIARDVAYVMAYLRITDEATNDKEKAHNDAEKAVPNIANGEVKLASDAKNQAAKDRRMIAALEAKDYNNEELVKSLKNPVTNEEQAKAEIERLTQEAERLEREAKEHSIAANSAMNMIPVNNNMFPDKLNLNAQEFETKVNAEKNRLFNGAESKNISIKELAGLTLNINHTYLNEVIGTKTHAEEAEYHRSAVVKYHNHMIGNLKAIAASTVDKQVSDKFKSFVEEFDKFAKNMNRIQQAQRDGSFVKCPSEIDEGFTTRLNSLKTKAAELIKGNENHYSNKAVDTKLGEMVKEFVKAVDNDLLAIKKGELFGVTEPRNIDKQIDILNTFGNTLKGSRKYFDGSSDEFKELLNAITSIDDNRIQGNRTDAKVNKYIEKLEKIRELSKEYLRHKQLKNNGSDRSLLRIDTAKKIVEYIDRIMPPVKDEARANSLDSRIAKMDYNREFTMMFSNVLDKMQDKQAEVDSLDDGPYKKISEMALSAREKLVDLLLKGEILKEDYKTNTELQNQVKECLATMILEKRIQLERSPEAERKHIEPTFTAKLKAVTKNEKAVEEPLLPTGNEDVMAEVDDINTSININAERAKANNNGNLTYKDLVKQVINYNFISKNYLNQDNIYKLLSDDKEVEKLYVEGLGKAMDTSQKERSKAFDKSVAAGKLDKEDVKALNDDAGIQTIKNIKL